MPKKRNSRKSLEKQIQDLTEDLPIRKWNNFLIALLACVFLTRLIMHYQKYYYFRNYPVDIVAARIIDISDFPTRWTNRGQLKQLNVKYCYQRTQYEESGYCFKVEDVDDLPYKILDTINIFVSSAKPEFWLCAGKRIIEK